MSASSRSAAHPEPNVVTTPSRTDWERVKHDAAADLHIPYDPTDPTDPDDGPYDPNDENAVKAFWDRARAEGRITRRSGESVRRAHPGRSNLELFEGGTGVWVAAIRLTN